MRRRLVRIANAVLDLEPFLRDSETPGNHSIAKAVLKLDRNELTTGPTPAALEAIRVFLNNRPLQWYPDSEAAELRAMISDYVSLPEQYISCYAGADLAVDHVFRTYLETGTELVTAGPISPELRIKALCTGAKVVEAEHKDNFQPTIEEIVNRISARTRAIYLGSPNDLTGTSLSEAEMVFLLAYSERSMIIVNEEYFEYTGATISDLVPRFPNLTVIRSFAKGFGLAALKAGYVISDPENLRFIDRIKGECGPDSIAQVAAMAALENVGYTREKVVEVNRSKKNLTDNLPDIGYEFRLSSANFGLLKVTDAKKAIEVLREEGIIATDLSRTARMEGYLRLTIGLPEQTDKLLLALSRMAEQFATGHNRNRLTASDDTTLKNKNMKPVSSI